MQGDARVLVVDDDAEIVDFIVLMLEDTPYDVYEAHGGREAIEQFEAVQPEVVLLDYMMPDMNGLEVLEELLIRDPRAAVVMITGHGSERVAVESLKAGAQDYVAKPFKIDDLLNRVDNALEQRQQKVVSDQPYERFIVGSSPLMQRVMDHVERAAPHSSNVLLTGETGTGKEVISRLIHEQSDRSDAPFYAINCSSMSEGTVESTLFGHVKGAFTGASQDRTGLFRSADGGTLLLDEIGELELQLQAKLLRTLQFQEIQPVGGTETYSVDVRVIAATNRDLEHDVEDGSFRRDLFFRLNVIAIELPPLRDRSEDIGLLAMNFLNKYRAQMRKTIRGISSEALRWLEKQPWPGNVRQLENTIERAVVLATGPELTLEDVNTGADDSVQDLGERLQNEGFYSIKEEAVSDIEQRMLREALTMGDGRVQDAAEIAQIPVSYFYRKVRKYEIDLDQFRTR